MTGNSSVPVLEHRDAMTEGDQTLSAIQATGDLALLASDPSVVERSADPGDVVIAILERAKVWLGEVLAVGGIEEILEIKSQAEAIRVYTKQKQLGKDSELAATEIVRRAERGLGLAVRRGQADGTIATRADAGRAAHGQQSADSTLLSPDSVFGNNSSERASSYAMADLATDEEFEEVLAEAKAEGSLARTAVVAKVKKLPSFREQHAAKWQRVAELAEQGWTSAQIARDVRMSEEGLRSGARRERIAIPADKLANHKRIKSTEVLEQLVLGLEVTESSLGLIRLEDISPEQARESLERLTSPLRALNKLKNQLKEIA